MPIKTTCIGAYPKHACVSAGNWSELQEQSGADDARGFSYVDGSSKPVSTADLDRATRDAIADQVGCGIDIPTDGEQRRENYIHYHCRHLEGFDFGLLTTKVHRNGAAVAALPTITAKIVPRGDHFLDRDFAAAQACTENPVKITLPGPVTIIDTSANRFYDDERSLAFDLAAALNFEARALADAGCKYIQIDEPLFARRVDSALDYGIECLERCFDGLPSDVTRVMHMCCGYPGHLDDKDYLKADPTSYGLLAKALNESCVDQISIEDAHRHNDLALLELFHSSQVILGCVAVASSQLESVDAIRERLTQALRHIDAGRLLAAPDCGLMMLGRDLAMDKLKHLVAAAQQCPG